GEQLSASTWRIPLLSKEGWTRPQEKYREATSDGADGVFAYSTTPSAPFKGRGPFSLWRSHPSLERRGIRPVPAVPKISTNPQAEYRDRNVAQKTAKPQKRRPDISASWC